ncbi:MAG: hypothetical protein KC486_28430 [Myxococcales bacterium]|nr:hypothetical protein [Myxococcales bacterium]
MQRRSTLRSALFVLALGLACKGGEANTDSDTQSTTDASVTLSAGTSSTSSTTATATATDTATSTTDTSSSTTDVSGSASDSDSSTGSTTNETTGGGACTPTVCESEGKILACGDCEDNDNDGKVDLADPECISPCDDNEETFATGLPGDNMDPCKQDCFFDGNSGGGKGDCAWNLKCDPMSPGGDKCPYDPDFNNCPMEQSQECVEGCITPNGCDCFGCCTVTVDGMDYDIYLGDETCKLADIDSCEKCTKNPDCDEDCNPDACEVCFGQTEPPEGCEEPSCDNEMLPCKIDKEGNHDCPEGFFCSTGCCWALIPG